MLFFYLEYRNYFTVEGCKLEDKKIWNVDTIIEATIHDMQQAMEQGIVTAQKLVMLYLERIAKYDKSGVSINSVIEVNPDALQIAEAMDQERQSKGPRGPLHGIPVLIKDNIDTHDKMHTSAGSIALANSIASADSYVAKQLRLAGAIILGKANMTEWANFMTVKMPNGFSSRGGQVLNPYGPGTFDVGGSSAGSGASVAANLTAVAIGTETSGSILSPASSNSTVGIKPTVGLISRTGIIPIAHSQDTAGPIARTVTDAAILLGALTGVDEKDPATWSSEGRALSDYTSNLDPNGLKGARIGVARDPYYGWLDEEQLSLMNNAIEELKQLGAEIIDPVTIPSSKEKWEYRVLTYEFKSDLNHYLFGLNPNVPVHSLKEVIEFNLRHEDVALKHGQTLLIESEATSGTLTEPAYLEGRLKDIELSREKGIDAVMEEHKLDALLFPANFGAGIPAKAGYPSITVPAGYTPAGVPLGITFSGLAYSEPTLIKLAYAYEQGTKHRVPPKMEK
jgi:amidase